jgi:hypothetical protein
MERHVMAALAELRRFFVEKVGMVASMDLMANQAVLYHGRMFKRKRSSFLCMAFVAEFIHGISLYHRLDVERSHRIVATRAFQLALSDGMMGLFIGLSSDSLVASEAEVRL